jgi:hypothetical protein
MQQQPLSGPAPEDAGATTADRYRFQYCCVGARLLAAIAERQACVVICEHHEDYLVLVDDGRMQAVSVKHREDHLAAWSVPSLAGADGNLGHLLDTFQRANGQIDCCFESNRAHRIGGLFSEDAVVDNPLRDDLAQRLSVTRRNLRAPRSARTDRGTEISGRIWSPRRLVRVRRSLDPRHQHRQRTQPNSRTDRRRRQLRRRLGLGTSWHPRHHDQDPHHPSQARTLNRRSRPCWRGSFAPMHLIILLAIALLALGPSDYLRRVADSARRYAAPRNRSRHRPTTATIRRRSNARPTRRGVGTPRTTPARQSRDLVRSAPVIRERFGGLPRPVVAVLRAVVRANPLRHSSTPRHKIGGSPL